jgi:N4-gp56 family major capsid protein
MATGQTTSTLSTVLGRYYDKKFIEWEKELIRMQQFAQMRPLPKHSGKTIFFSGYRPHAIVTSALTENTGSTENSYAARQINATVAEYGDVHRMGTLLSMTKLDPALTEQVQLDADQAARSVDYFMMQEVCRNGIWGINPTPARINTITATVINTASNSTVAFKFAMALATDDITGGVATVVSDGGVDATNSVKYGYAGRIASIATSATHVFVTLSSAAPGRAAGEAFASNDVIRIVGWNGMTDTSTNKTDTGAVRLAQRDLVGNRARAYGDGYYGALTNPWTDYDFKGDTTWVNAASYSNISALWRGEIGRWFGFRFVETTQPWRETVNGTAALTTGNVYFDLFFGQDSFGHTNLEGQDQIVYVHQGADKRDPLDMYSLVGWKRIFANRALTAPHAVAIGSYATT